MCDTITVVFDDRVLFAKNSDRDANEAQLLDWQPASEYRPGASVRCTWITIPQVEHTHAVMLSRPFWMFGAEMGFNEHGVTIGNEAVFTKAPAQAVGLLGMDLVRLGLERAMTAEQAVEVIIELLETHGQGGSCGFEDPDFTYDSSYIVADHRGAFVLETAGREHAVETVDRGVRSISNGLTIPGFAERHERWLEPAVACAVARQLRTTAIARSATTPRDMMRALRDHGGRAEPRYRLINGSLGSPCMHGGGVAAASVSTGALVTELRAEGTRAWATGTSGTCTSIFKPVRVDAPIDLGSPTGAADAKSLWWRHERFHRRVIKSPAEIRPMFEAERDEVEERWVSSPPEPAEAFAEADALLEGWTRRAAAAAAGDVRPIWARRYWRVRDRDAKLR